MSARHFARAFTAETGMTPAKAVERLRLEAARERVESGSEPIEGIRRRHRLSRSGTDAPRLSARVRPATAGHAPAREAQHRPRCFMSGARAGYPLLAGQPPYDRRSGRESPVGNGEIGEPVNFPARPHLLNDRLDPPFGLAPAVVGDGDERGLLSSIERNRSPASSRSCRVFAHTVCAMRSAGSWTTAPVPVDTV
jgi:hypothetical protein